MRISVSGTTCIGKSTFVQDFCKHWSNYSSPRYSYRDELSKLPHSKTCTKDTQWLILNSMIDELQKHSKTDHVIFDRCPLDNLVYSMWAFDKGEGDIARHNLLCAHYSSSSCCSRREWVERD